MIEIVQRRYDVIAVDTTTGRRIGYHDPTGGANRGVVRGVYVQPETRAAWIVRIEALESDAQ